MAFNLEEEAYRINNFVAEIALAVLVTQAFLLAPVIQAYLQLQVIQAAQVIRLVTQVSLAVDIIVHMEEVNLVDIVIIIIPLVVVVKILQL